MDKKPTREPERQRDPTRPAATGETAVENRETWVRARETAADSREFELTSREQVARLRDEALRARAEADEARADRERLVLEMREANEKLVLATVRADELVEEANAARALTASGVEALRASEAHLRSLANTVPMLAWYANPDGYVPWYNQRWYDYTGTTFEQQAGWKWESVHDPSDLPRILDKWRAALASGEPWEDVFRLRRHDGEFRWFLSRASPLRDSSGHIVQWFGTNVDIDDQQRAQAQVQATSRAKDEFLAMLGHELRNPLAPIVTALDLMSMREPSVYERERTIIGHQVSHLVRLVDDLLDVSRITSGKIELRRNPIEIAEVVTRAVEMASPLLEQKSHELIVDVSPRGLVVDCDANRLAQVVSNLLTNAAKYTPARGTISVTGGRRGSRVLLRVRDTGIGMSAEMLPRVFDLFAQERQAIDRSLGGLGLGLAIVKSLVTMHGGTATAHSEGVGRGSELVIELPASTADRDVGRDEQRNHGGVAPRAGRSAAGKILVVDDNRDAAELMADLLTSYGYKVRVAFDGPSALALVAGFVPDVALLDIGLPVMDGYELATRLRELFAPREIRFIAITGYGQAIERARSLDAGFALHLIKPVDVTTLQASIDRVIEGTSFPLGSP